jgi:hypothetical protein
MEQPQESSKGAFGWFTRLVDKAKTWWHSKAVPWARANPVPAALIASGAAVGGLLWVGGAVLVNGLIAGLLVAAAAGIIIWKMKTSNSFYLVWTHNLMVSHPLATDVVISLIALAIAPGGITGWVAAAITALVASVWLVGAEPAPLPEVKDDVIEAELINTVEITEYAGGE